MMSVIIRLQGLSWSASAMDIRNFFQGLSIPPGGVHIIGGENGDAFIAFTTDEDARQAMMMSNKLLNDAPVQLFLSSKTEMQNTIVKAKEVSTPAVPVAPAALPLQQTGGQPTQQNLFGVQGFSSVQLQQIAQHIGLTQGDMNKHTPQRSVQQPVPRDIEQPLPGEYSVGGMQENAFNPISQPLSQSYQQPSMQGRVFQPPHQQQFQGQQFQGPTHTMQTENVSNNNVNKHWGAVPPPNSVPSSIIQNVSNLLQGDVGKHLDIIKNTLQLPKVTPTSEDVGRNETARFPNVQSGTTKPSEPMSFDYQNRQRFAGAPDLPLLGRPPVMFNQDKPPFPERSDRPPYPERSDGQTSTRPPVMFNQDRPPFPERSDGQTSTRNPVMFNQERPSYPERSDVQTSTRPPSMFNEDRPQFPERSGGQAPTRAPVIFNQDRPPFQERSDRPPFPERSDRPPFSERSDRPPFQERSDRPQFTERSDRPPFTERSDGQTPIRPPVMFNQERPPFSARSDGQTATRPPIMFNQERLPFPARSDAQTPLRPPAMFNQERLQFPARSDAQTPLRPPAMFNQERPPSSERSDMPTSQKPPVMFNQERQPFSETSNLQTLPRPPVMFNQVRPPFSERSDRQTPPRFPFQGHPGPFANLPPPNQRFTPPNQRLSPDKFSNVKPSLLGPGPGGKNECPPQESKFNKSKDDFGQSEMLPTTQMETTANTSNSNGTVQVRNNVDQLNQKADAVISKGTPEKGKKSEPRDSRSGRDRDRERDRSRDRDRDRDRSKYRDSPRYDRDKRDRDRSRGTDRDDDRRRRDRDRGRDRDRRDRKDDRHSREKSRDTDKKSNSPGSSRRSSKKRSLSPESKNKNEKEKKLQTNKTESQPDKPATTVAGGSPLSHSIALTLQQLEDAERKDSADDKKENLIEVPSNEVKQVKQSSQTSEKKQDSQTSKTNSGEPRRRSRFEANEEAQGQGGNIVDTKSESGVSGNDRKGSAQNERNSESRHSGRNIDRSVNRDERRDSRNIHQGDNHDDRGHSTMNREGNEMNGPPSFNRRHGEELDRSGFRGAGNQSNVGDAGDNSEVRGPRDRFDIRNSSDRPEFRGPGNRVDFRGQEDRSSFRGQDKRSDFRGHGDRSEFRGREEGSDFSRGPDGRSNNRGPDNRADYRGPENRSDFIGMENHSEFRGPSDAPNLRVSGSRNDFRGPENRPDYGGPVHHSDFSGHDDREDFMDIDVQSDIRGPGDHQDFRGPGDNSNLRGQDNRTDFRSPESRNHFRGSGDHPDFRGQENPLDFREHVGQSDFRGPGDHQDFRGRGDVPDFRGRGDVPDFRGRGDVPDFRGRGDVPDFRGPRERDFRGPGDRSDFRSPGNSSDFRGNPTDSHEFDGQNRRPPPLLPDFHGQRFGPPLNERDAEHMSGRRPALLANPPGFDFQGPRGRGGPPPRFGPPSRDSFRPPSLNEIRAPRPDTRNIPDNPNDRPPNHPGRRPNIIERNNTISDAPGNVKTNIPGDKDKNERTPQEKTTIIIERLPVDTKYKDIRKLFSGKDIPRDGIKIINDSKGDRTGTAYVRFASSRAQKSALLLDRTRFKGNHIVIRHVQQKEYDEAVDLFVPDDSDDESNGGRKKIELRNTLSATLRVLKGEEEKKTSATTVDLGDNIVRIETLPMSATAYQVKELFKECKIRKENEGIVFQKDHKGCRTGVCYVEFVDADSFKKALNHKPVFRNAPISIFPVSKNERDDLMKLQLSIDQKKGDENSTKDMRCIRIGNIPKDFIYTNVRHLLSGIEIATRGVTICHDAIGKPMGECYVELISTKEVEKALTKDGLLIGSEHISIQPVTKDKMIENLRDLRLALQPEQPTQQAVFYFVKATNLPKGITTGELINFFTNYRSSPESIRLNVGDLTDKEECTTALIGFKQREDAEKAVEEKQGSLIRDRPVALAKVILGGQ